MLIPFSHTQTEEERYKERVRVAKIKAKHLSERMDMFLKDLRKMDKKDIIAIRDQALKFLDYHGTYLP